MSDVGAAEKGNMATPATTASSTSAAVSRISKGRWLIRVERKQNGETAAGQVAIAQEAAPDPVDPQHLALAGARAWLALARSRHAANDMEAAMASARSGIEELGQDYAASLRVMDDTSLHLDLAEEQAEQGQAAAATQRLINVLDDRLKLYARSHAATIAE